MENILSTERRMRVLTVGASALCGLYLLTAFVAEPLRSLAATASDNDNKVSVTVVSSITLSCTDENSDGNGDNNNLTISGSLTVGSDTGNYNVSDDYKCVVSTNDSAGYTLAWRVDTGSGGTATGYMISQFEDKIMPFRYNNSNDAETDAVDWGISASDAEWGARLSSTSDSFSDVHASRQITAAEWDTNGGAEDWARVSSGSAVIFAASDNETIDAGDNVYIGFRAAIGATRYQPTGVYEVLVDFTAATTN
jgi:hypothetical protein